VNSFTAVLKNEIEKIYRRKKATVIVILAIIGTIVGQLIVSSIQNGFGIRPVNGIDFSILVLSFFVNTIMPLFAAMVIIDCFSGEFSKNTMKIVLLRPVSRIKIFAAKILATGTFIIINLLVVMIISLMIGLMLKPAEHIVSGIIMVFISYIVSFFPLFVLTIIVAFMANAFKSGTIVFFLSIVIFIIFKAVALFFPQYSTLFITSLLEWYNLWKAGTLPVLKLFREFLIMASYGIIFFIAGYYLFDKKEI